MRDHYLQLLTAFVDGELTRRQRRAVLRLLHRSSSARQILAELQENAHGLKQLPQMQLPGDFSEAVLQALQSVPVSSPNHFAQTSIKEFALATSRTFTPVRLAMAASLLLVGGSLGYFLRYSGDINQPPLPVANNSTFKDNQVNQKSGVSFKFQELQQEPKQKLLAEELAKTPAVELDLTVKNAPQAVERIRDVLQNQGIRLLVNPELANNVQEKSETYLVFAENVQPKEVTAILQQMVPEGSTSPRNFDSFLVHVMDAEDRKLLAGTLGVEAWRKEDKLFDGNIIEGPQKISTIQGSNNPRNPGERFAVMVPIASEETRGVNSPEVQKFLNNRQQRQPGAVQVLLLLQKSRD